MESWESWLVSLETCSQNASEETGFHKRSDRPCENTSAPRRCRCFCLRGGVKMSALQSVMSQLVISIRCNCITPAVESDSKKGRRGGSLAGRRAAYRLQHWHRSKRQHEPDVYAVLSAWCIFLSITMPLLIPWRAIPLYLSLNENYKVFGQNQRKETKCDVSASSLEYIMYK